MSTDSLKVKKVNESMTYDLNGKCTWARSRVPWRGISSTRNTSDSLGWMVRLDGEFTMKYRDAAAYVPLISFAPPRVKWRRSSTKLPARHVGCSKKPRLLQGQATEMTGCKNWELYDSLSRNRLFLLDKRHTYSHVLNSRFRRHVILCQSFCYFNCYMQIT